MLLNVAPKADGSFPEEQKNVMLGIGNLLKINGEAIYNIQP
jgi:alpha-L-fucosidase